jgi:hypothetical protein
MLWQSLSAGDSFFNGFSLEGFFKRVPVTMSNQEKNTIEIYNELLDLLNLFQG